ncbi:MAG: hypothetical protein HEP71_30545 [Roseivirga sp.]|nr:hypothetical protein [Roseivirga sp.]
MIFSLNNLQNTVLGTLKSRISALLVLGCFLVLPCGVDAQEVIEVSDADFDISLFVGQQLLAFEDSSATMTVDDMVRLQPFSEQFTRGNKKGIYWMKFTLTNTSDEDIDIAWFHSRMSNASLHLVREDSLLFSGRSGEYLKGSEMEKTESRYHLFFRLDANAREDVYVRIQNTRDRGPKLLVRLKGTTRFYADQRTKTTSDFVLLGALSILILYALVLYVVHRYRPYLWLSLMVLGFAAYTFAVNGYHTDWLFPEYPKFSKTFTPPIGQFGKFCMLMLLLSFLEVKKKYIRWYRVFQGLIVMYLVRFAYMYYVTVANEAFGLSTLIGSVTAIITNVIYIAFVISVFRKLNLGKKVFATGLVIYAVGVVVVGYFWVFQAIAREAASLMSSTVTLLETLLFTIALGIEMRQHEVDKNKALTRLNQVQADQTRKIEQEVVDRTAKVNQQKLELQERNERIETLFKEVHHRVKNNLQLVSSLLNMQQEWSSTEDPAKAIEDSRSRVVAMSMIHQFLYRTDDIATIDFKEYTEELINKLDAIQVDRVPYKLQLEFESNTIFDIDTSISLGLILNELVTNSYKHALLLQRKLELTVGLEALGAGMFNLVYKDNGEAIKEPFAEVIKKGFGLRLASRLAKQLQGKLDYNYDQGNRFTINFANEEARSKLIE